MMTDRVILVCTLIVAAVYLYATTLIPSIEIGDPLGPKAFPRLIGVAMLVAAGMLGLEMWKARRASKPAATEEPLFEWRTVRMLLVVVAWTAAYYASLQTAGYIVASSIYLLALMAWFHRGKWLVNALSAVSFSALTYLLFVKLDVTLPQGFLPF